MFNIMPYSHSGSGRNRRPLVITPRRDSFAPRFWSLIYVLLLLTCCAYDYPHLLVPGNMYMVARLFP